MAKKERESDSGSFSLTTSFTLLNYQAFGWHLMRLKGMEDFASFRVRKVKRAAAEERERDEYYSAQRQ